MLFLDLETRSRCDLKTAGVYKYASDPSTEILCVGWGFDKDNCGVDGPRDLPHEVGDYIRNSDGLVASHGAFDRLVWNACVHPNYRIPLNRWYCTMTQMRVNALPAALDKASKAVYGRNYKDVRGSYLIRMLSIPQEDGTFNEDPQLMREMSQYCLQDVRLMIDLCNDTRMMTEQELRDYHNSEIINDDGVRVDVPFAKVATEYADREKAELTKRISQLTGNAITKITQTQRIREYVEPLLTEEQRALATVHKKGEKKFSLDKAARGRLLVADEERLYPLHDSARQLLNLMEEGSSTSVAKYQRMVDMADDEDRRVRGAFVYGGAAQTIRYSSKGLQLHNMRRDCMTDEEYTKFANALYQGRTGRKGLMTNLARAMRGAIVPEPGNVFVVGDWSAIEACGLPWLSGDNRARKRLNILADPKRDIYMETCNDLGLEGERQIGKVVELACGYGGSIGAFYAMAQIYGVAVPEAQAKMLVDAWRSANPWAVDFWNSLENAAMNAVRHPTTPYVAGRVKYCFYPGLVDGTLICTLPCGQMISYPRAKIEREETEFGERYSLTALKANWTPAAGEKEWPRVSLWRGLLAENVTQATCASVLRHGIDASLHEGWSVVAHVHDEIVWETPEELGRDGYFALKKIMTTPPRWATGLPLRAEPEIMKRYGK